MTTEAKPEEIFASNAEALECLFSVIQNQWYEAGLYKKTPYKEIVYQLNSQIIKKYQDRKYLQECLNQSDGS